MSLTVNIETRLKIILDERGIKTGWLADRLGVTYQTVWNIKSGAYVPPYEMQVKIAHLLNSTVAELWPATVETVDA